MLLRKYVRSTRIYVIIYRVCRALYVRYIASYRNSFPSRRGRRADRWTGENVSTMRLERRERREYVENVEIVENTTSRICPG